MDIQQIMGTLKEQMGSKFNKEKVESALKNVDLSKSAGDIMASVKARLRDLDGDGKEEGILEEIKGKIGGLFGK